MLRAGVATPVALWRWYRLILCSYVVNGHVSKLICVANKTNTQIMRIQLYTSKAIGTIKSFSFRILRYVS